MTSRDDLEKQRAQDGFDKAWAIVATGPHAIVRELAAGKVHIRTRGGMNVVFAKADLPALRAAIAMLEGR